MIHFRLEEYMKANHQIKKRQIGAIAIAMITGTGDHRNGNSTDLPFFDLVICFHILLQSEVDHFIPASHCIAML